MIRLSAFPFVAFLFFANTLFAQYPVPFKNTAGLYGYKKANGQVLIQPKYMSAQPFSEGYAAVWNGKGGFIDSTGREVIPLKYDMTQSFKNGLARVSLSGQWFYINKAGIKTTTVPVAPATVSDKSRFAVLYALDRTPEGKVYMNEVVRYLQTSGLVNTMVERLNATFKLPHSVSIRFQWVGDVNAFYNPNDRNIYFGLEMVDFIYAKFKTVYAGERLNAAVNNALVFFLFHEVGHALKDIYELPIPGNQESAVDDFSCFLLSNRSDDQTEQAALDGASSFALFANDSNMHTPYWDEHPFDLQRYYYILCRLYGKNPAKYAAIVAQNKLPDHWKAGCGEAYTSMIKDWKKLLQPYLK
jgi:Putative metallopeptidase/WG containing repeat